MLKTPINLNSDLISEKSDDTFEGPKADDDIDTAARKEFNTWYAEQLETKKKEPKVRESDGFSSSSKQDVYSENQEHIQQFPTSWSNQSPDVKNNPDLLCYLQAYFIMFLSICKTLNDKIENLPQSSFPMTTFPSPQQGQEKCSEL